MCVGAGRAAIYNPTTDFSVTQNQNVNGVWSYGYENASFGNFQLMNYNEPASGTPLGWRVLQYQDSGNIWVNTAAYSQYGVSPGQLSLHPNEDGTPTVLRWIAPSAGSFTINGQFLAGDVGTPDIAVLVNGTKVWTGNNAGSFNLNGSIAAGGDIDFAVYFDSSVRNWYNDNTPLVATVNFSPVPEPTTMVAGVGAIGMVLAGMARSRRSSVARIGK
jgi:hypothetical protein